MARTLDTEARVTLAVIALCGAMLVPLLALSPGDATVAASAWVGGVGLSYLAVVGVTRRKGATAHD